AKGGLGYQPGRNTALVPTTQKPWLVPLYQQFHRGEFIQGHDQITPLLPPTKVVRPAYRDTLGSLRPHKKLKTIKIADEYEEWEDIGELAQALSQLFLHEDLPPLLDFPVHSHSDTSEEQLLLLSKLKIQKPESPSCKGHFNGGRLWLAEEAHIRLCNKAPLTIQVAHRRFPIYTVTLISLMSLPPLSMSFSPFAP